LVEEERDERSADARALAERALVWLLHELRESEVRPIVLGGLVPPLLSAQSVSAPQHLGTADVDILLITHLEDLEGLAAVEDALERMDFEPIEPWRWSGRVGGRGVRIEFLCDVPEYQAGTLIRPPGCRDLAASNLRGTGYVQHGTIEVELSATLPDAGAVSVTARFAGLAGYLLSKCAAIRNRAEAKDFYDFVYVLMHNDEGGPQEAAARVNQEPFAVARRELRSTFIEVRARYGRTADAGPAGYAAQALRVRPDDDSSRLRAQAVAAVAAFFDAVNP
jgi:hypothetical protein